MFKRLREKEIAIQNWIATRHARKEAKNLINTLDLEALQTLLNKKTVGSDKVTESTKQIEQKTRTITEYTYFVNPEIETTKGKKMTGEKAHGLITLRLRAFGVIVKKFNRSKSGKKEEYIVFSGNTDEQNQKINEVFETVKEFQNYLHRSKRGQKEVIIK